MKIQNFFNYFKRKKYIIVFVFLIMVALVISFTYLKISSEPNIISSIKFSIPEDAKAILEKYNLSVKELSERRLVITDPQNCTMYIYSASLRPVIVDVTIIKEFNLSVMEEDTDDRYIYIGGIVKTVKSENITIYKMYVYFKNEGVVYTAICNLQKLKEIYLPAADELLKVYKEIFSS